MEFQKGGIVQRKGLIIAPSEAVIPLSKFKEIMKGVNIDKTKTINIQLNINVKGRMIMKAEEQVQGWFDSLKPEEKDEIFKGRSVDPEHWWAASTLKDRNDLMVNFGQRIDKPLGNIPEEKDV